jgi:hypothetical protein
MTIVRCGGREHLECFLYNCCGKSSKCHHFRKHVYMYDCVVNTCDKFSVVLKNIKCIEVEEDDKS